MNTLSRRELERLVAFQLGRMPQIGFNLAVACSYGWPAVIRNEPYTLTGRPNPNLYYLTCPYLRRALAVMEERGWIVRLQKLAETEPVFARHLVHAQREHAATWQRLAGRPWPSADAKAPRIAAASSDFAIKCLHAHVAWSLTHGGYPPGAVLLGAIGTGWCRDERCAFLGSDQGSADRHADDRE